MNIPLIIIYILLSLVALFAVTYLILQWYAYRYKKFNPPISINTQSFELKTYNNIPYILDRGIPYRANVISNSQKVLLNDGYTLAVNKQDNVVEENITIPHCYNSIDNEFKDYRGDVWYSKKFYYKSEKDKVAMLTFEGSFHLTNVWIDNKHLGENAEGYLPFSYDISYLEEGEHLLLIKVNNNTSLHTIPLRLYDEHKAGWYYYSGIHKSIYVEYLPASYVFKLTCIPLYRDNSWYNEMSLLLRNTCNSKNKLDYSVDIYDCNKNIVYSYKDAVNFSRGESINGIKKTIPIDNPILYSADTPNLYKLVLKTEDEECTASFGLRIVGKNRGKITINNQEIFLKGICRHEDNGVVGLVEDREVIDKELEIIKDLNANFVRLAHYPHSKFTMDLTDSKGLYAWSEVPLYQAGNYLTQDKYVRGLFSYIKAHINTNKARDNELLITTAQSLLKLIERDINHPSIITWGVGNEIWSVNPANGRALSWLRDLVLSYDNSRAVNFAAMCMPGITERYESSFEHMDWLCINEYYGWYYGKPEDVSKLAELLTSKYPDKPLVITETGSDTKYALRDSNIPPINKYSEEYQSYMIKTQWNSLKDNPLFCGFTIWLLKDFACPQYSEDNIVPLVNAKGLMDKDYNIKDSYYVYKDINKNNK